jgi:hypothetical protein
MAGVVVSGIQLSEESLVEPGRLLAYPVEGCIGSGFEPGGEAGTEEVWYRSHVWFAVGSAFGPGHLVAKPSGGDGGIGHDQLFGQGVVDAIASGSRGQIGEFGTSGGGVREGESDDRLAIKGGGKGGERGFGVVLEPGASGGGIRASPEAEELANLGDAMVAAGQGEGEGQAELGAPGIGEGDGGLE